MKHFIYLIALMALLTAGCAPDTPAALAASAEKAYREERYPRAIEAYEQLIHIAGESPVNRLNLALCALQVQDLEFARINAAKAIEADPEGETGETAREILGILAEHAKDDAAAAKQYRALIHSKYTDIRIRARSRLARIYADSGRHDSAFALLLASLNERPTDAVSLYNLGKFCIREQMNMRSSALDYLRQAERLLSNNPKAATQSRDARAYIQRLEGYTARLRNIPRAVGNPEACAKALRLAREAKAKKRWTRAEELAADAAKANPADAEAALELARTAARNANTDTALRAYDTTLSLRPNDTSARSEAAQLAYTAKQYDKALRYLRPALTVRPRDRMYADLMMRILAAQNRRPDARVWGEYYLSLDANATDAYKRWVRSLPEY